MELYATQGLSLALLVALIAPVVLNAAAAVDCQDTGTVCMSLTTNSTASCDTGLTHSGVFLLVEYRLTDSETSSWRLLKTIRLNTTAGM